MKKDKLIRIYYKLIEKQNLFFLNGNSFNLFLLLKMHLIKRRIFKNLDSDTTEKLVLDKILNKIDNNRNLKKLANIYNKKKSVESLQAYISYKNKLSKGFGFNNFQEVIIKKISLYSHSRMDIDEMIKINDLSSLNNWLKENIYQYGTQYGPSELLKKSTKEELNCNYYLDSLHLER